MFFRKIFRNTPIDDEWVSFSRKKKRGKSFLKVNRAFSSFGHPRGYKYFLKISIFLNEYVEKNHDILYEIEDKLSEKLEDDFGALLIGTQKTEKKYNVYFYSKTDKNALSEMITVIMQQFPSVNFGISIEKDRPWKQYFKNIAPSDFEFETYKNELKFYQGEKKYFGQEKVFFYFISYRNEKIFSHFKRELEKLGFEVLSLGAGKRKKFPYALKIGKKQVFRLEEINNSVEKLLNLSEKYQFMYEGWVLESKNKKKKS